MCSGPGCGIRSGGPGARGSCRTPCSALVSAMEGIEIRGRRGGHRVQEESCRQQSEYKQSAAELDRARGSRQAVVRSADDDRRGGACGSRRASRLQCLCKTRGGDDEESTRVIRRSGGQVVAMSECVRWRVSISSYRRALGGFRCWWTWRWEVGPGRRGGRRSPARGQDDAVGDRAGLEERTWKGAAWGSIWAGRWTRSVTGFGSRDCVG